MSKADASGSRADGKARKRKRNGTPLELVNETATEAGNTKFARALASSDYSTRDKGLQVLTLWLKRRPNITDADLSKIWKGLFYAFWHADKAPVQVAVGYFRMFLATMRREWFGIDRLRLDKFMLLVRKFMQQMFVHLRNADWDEQRIEPFVDALTEGVLLKEDGPPALGLVYHLADCYTPELLAADQQEAIPEEAIPLLLSPFVQLLAGLRQAAGISRVMGSAFGPLLAACQSRADSSPSFATTQLLAGMARTAFELGAQPEVRTRNREALYGLSKQLQKAAKKVARDSPAAADGTALHPAQAKQSAAVQPADAAAARVTAAGAAAPGTPAAKRAANKALSRLARASVAADPATDADNLAQAVPSEAVAVSPEGDAAAAVPATPSTAKKAKRKKQRTGSQPALTVPTVNSSAVLAEGGAEAGANVHRTRSATGASAAAPPGNDATPGGAAVNGSRPATASRLADGDAAASAERKSVHFRLKQNLHFAYGGPVPSPEVRTPPGARPKGPALRVQPATDPGHGALTSGKRQKRKLMSPASIPRPKAAEYFDRVPRERAAAMLPYADGR